MYDLESKKYSVSQDIIFDEYKFSYANDSLGNLVQAHLPQISVHMDSPLLDSPFLLWAFL